MKRWLAALLTLCLTLSMLPAALAEDVSAAVDAPVEEIELALGARRTKRRPRRKMRLRSPRPTPLSPTTGCIPTATGILT